MSAGRHVIYDGAAPAAAWRAMRAHPGLGLLLKQIARDAGATSLDGRVIELPHPNSRPGSPPGGTAWIGLDESHITLHWYDDGDWVRFALDAFACGQHADPSAMVDAFLAHLPGVEGTRREFVRFLGAELARGAG